MVAGWTLGLASKSNKESHLLRVKPGGFDPSFRSAPVAFIALGHQQFGEEAGLHARGECSRGPGLFERGRPRQGTGLAGEGLKVVIQDEP